MSTHAWVQIVMVPVEVSLADDGELKVHTREAALEISQEDAQYGCWLCEEPLSHELFQGVCPGANIDAGFTEPPN